MNKSLLVLATVAVVGQASAVTVFSEDFNGGGTGVFSVTNTSVTKWADMGFYGDSNYTGGTGNAMTADDDFKGSAAAGAFDTSATALVNGVGYTGLSLSFKLNFQKNGTNGSVTVPDADRLEIYAGATLLDTIASDTGTLFGTSNVVKTYNLAAFDNSAFNLKFRFVDESTSAWEWYAQVDDVLVTGNPVPEPATMAVLGLGAAAIMRRRRKS